MSTQITCPDCGGILGSTEPGVKACTCFQTVNLDKSGDTEISESPATSSAKLCAVCGKDVSGHRRFKDSRGYICRECNQAEKAAEREGKVQCPECKRYVKPAGMMEWKGKFICRTCRDGHSELEGKRVHIVSAKNFDEAEKQNIIRIAIVLGVLLVLMIIGWWKMKHGG